MAKVVVRKGSKIYEVNDSDNLEKWEQSWNQKYALLIEYKKIFGNMKMKESFDTWELTLKFQKLPRWVQGQREAYHEGRLKLHRQNLLCEIGFSFEPILDQWLAQYQLLKEYKDEHGTCVIYYKNNNKLKDLHRWAYTQRKNYRILSDFQKNRMNELGFNWNTKEERWFQNLEKLKAYKAKFGHCNVPCPHKNAKRNADFDKLARFVSFQRRQFTKGSLPDKYYDELIKIGFQFDTIPNKWEIQLEKLIEYKKKYGDCNVPDKWKQNYPLSTWVRIQRSEKETMTSARRIILEAVGFIWDAHEYNFLQRYSVLKQFWLKNGHCKLPRIENVPLFLWMNYIRQIKRKKEKLSEEQINLLNEIGFDWEPYETMWEAGYKSLSEFKNEFGHCNVIYTRKLRKLHRWVLKQRKDKEILSDEKMQRLNDLGFVW